MGSFSVWHWLVVLVIIVLVFGTKKLRNVGEDLGRGIRSFKEGLGDLQDTGKKDGRPLMENTETDASFVENPPKT